MLFGSESSEGLKKIAVGQPLYQHLQKALEEAVDCSVE